MSARARGSTPATVEQRRAVAVSARVRGSTPRVARLVVLLSLTVAGAAPLAHAANPLARRPVLSARSAILVEPSGGAVVYSRDAGQRRRMASTTKLMTVLLTLEHARLTQRYAAVRYAAQPAESVAGLRAGERLTVADLLRATLIASANDAAATLAQRVGGSQARFVALMNARARALGLRGTHYANAIGLDAPGNYSTARDLATLALAVRQHAFAREVMNRPSVVLLSGDHPRRLANRNTLVRDVAWISGVKTGHTRQAGYVLVGSGSRNGVELVSVVMGDPTEGLRNVDTLLLLNYGFTRYHRVSAAVAGQVRLTVAIRDRAVRVGLAPARTIRVVALRSDHVTTVPIGVPATVDGPLTRGETLGTLAIRRGGRTIGSVPLVTTTAVARAGFWQRNGWIAPLAGLMAVVAVVGSLGRANRRRMRRRGRSRSEPA